MFFFSCDAPGVGHIVKKCSCGRGFNANDWLDLIPIGFMDGGDDYTLLDMRNCPCGSTICTEVLIGVDPNVGLPTNMGSQAIEAAKHDMEIRAAIRKLLSQRQRATTIPAPAEPS